MRFWGDGRALLRTERAGVIVTERFERRRGFSPPRRSFTVRYSKGSSLARVEGQQSRTGRPLSRKSCRCPKSKSCPQVPAPVTLWGRQWQPGVCMWRQAAQCRASLAHGRAMRCVLLQAVTDVASATLNEHRAILQPRSGLPTFSSGTEPSEATLMYVPALLPLSLLCGRASDLRDGVPHVLSSSLCLRILPGFPVRRTAL